MTPQVWSERQDGPWYACVYAAYLAALAVAGHARWPLGVFTNAERWAFEASQTIKPQGTSGNFTAADQAAATRYGPSRVLRAAADLAVLLATPGLVIAVAGSNDRLVTRLRRWQPAYTGGHAATIVTLGPAGLLWLDPLAPMSYAGEPISAAELMAWWNANPVRYFRVGELTVTTVTKTLLTPARAVRFAAGTYRGYDPTSLLPTAIVTIAAAGSSALAAASVVIAPAPPWAPTGALLIANGALVGRYVPTAGLTLAPAPPPPPLDCAPAVAARDAAWRLALGKVAP